ncbi:MAG: peptidylprolyl isomerase [Cyclobacteriaceae bacterium]|nr:peptidylprolyl isomerase [Cyclobacteriaceae bacterium]
MTKAKKGDRVRVHYTGKLTTGETFDSSIGREPLEFELGAGMMIKGFDSAVDGMTLGEKVTSTIPSAEAYGEAREDLIFTFPKSNLPEDMEIQVGMQLAMNAEDNQQIPVRVTEISEDTITLDANHDLAGKDLVFEIELVEIL